MPRKQHTYHYIYKIVNIITNKYYLGMHSTSNLEDEYLGSGKVLKRSLNKYGKANHKLEILEHLENREDLKKREREIITVEILKDPMCMNLAIGGQGGLLNETHAKAFHKAGGKATLVILRKRHIEKLKNDLQYREKYIKKLSDVQSGENAGFYNKKHTDETKAKIGISNSISQLGKRNSQFGTCWITNNIINKKIKKEELKAYEQNGWNVGRTKITN
jgi:group I intron endonuclease